MKKHALAAVAAIFLLAAGAATAGGGQQTYVLRLDGTHLPIRSTTWRPGAVRIDVTATRGEQELTLLRFRPGYGYGRFLADREQTEGRGKATLSAFARIAAGTEFLGGVDVFPGQHASFTVLVRPGVYYLGELNDRPLFRTIHVGGASASPLGGAAARVEEYDFGFHVAGGVLPAHGTIAIHNSGGQPHRLNLEPVEPGTTRAQLAAYLRTSGGRPYGPPPSFARRGPEIGTSLLGPGETIHFGYSVPPGTYALIGWQQDSRTGKPQALEGMYTIVRFR